MISISGQWMAMNSYQKWFIPIRIILLTALSVTGNDNFGNVLIAYHNKWGIKSDRREREGGRGTDQSKKLK